MKLAADQTDHKEVDHKEVGSVDADQTVGSAADLADQIEDSDQTAGFDEQNPDRTVGFVDQTEDSDPAD